MRKLLFTILCYCYAGHVLAQVGVYINNGEEFTNSREVVLTLASFNADSIRLSDQYEEVASQAWQPYQRKVPFRLSEGDGRKEVFVQFLLPQGIETDIFANDIELDTEPPTALEIVLGNSTYTTTRFGLNLKLYAEGATSVMVSNSPDYRGARWVPYKEEINWSLNPGDGDKIVYAKFKDIAGNVSETVTAKTILDTQPPANGFLSINIANAVYDSAEKVKYVNKNTQFVDLEISAEDAKYMAISNDRAFYGTRWQFYDEFYYGWDMGDLRDGKHTVYIKFKDIAQNESAVYSDFVIVDTNRPAGGKIAINDGQPLGKSKDATLSIFIKGASEMIVDNVRTFNNASWQPYKEKIDWQLKDGEGLRRVYAMFRDKALNLSDTYVDSITIDTSPPYDLSIQINEGQAETFSHILNVSLKAKDAVQMQLTDQPDFSKSVWQNYTEQPYRLATNKEGGSKVLKARFKDNAGNISDVITDSIVLAVMPTRCQVSIEDGAEYATHPNNQVSLRLFAIAAAEIMISNTAGFENAKWEPYSENKTWQLKANNGAAEVFVKYRSTTQTESEVIKDVILVDTEPPKRPGIQLAHGSAYQRASSLSIEITASAEGAQSMQISEDPAFNRTVWRPYTDITFTYQITAPGSGEKVVYARFKDRAGNISKTVSGKIAISLQTPNNREFVVEDGRRILPTKKPTIHFKQTDIDSVKISADGDFIRKSWMPFKEVIEWEIPGEDGQKTINVQFLDRAGNIFIGKPVEVVIDTSPPVAPDISVKDSVITAANKQLTVYLSAKNATKMAISQNPDFSDVAFISYQNILRGYQLTGEDGQKTIYAKFADEAGNETATVQQQVLLDRQGPQSISISINNGSKLSNTHEVSLMLETDDAAEMIISNNGYFGSPSKWVAAQQQLNWQLYGYDGEKTVYIKFKDKYGNESRVLQTNIYLDTAPPIFYSFKINGDDTMVDGTSVTLQMETEGAETMQISNESSFSNSEWEPYKKTKEWQMVGAGLQKVYARFKDKAGNISATFTAKIMVYL